jgi:CheY-like chemotaxis protein
MRNLPPGNVQVVACESEAELLEQLADARPDALVIGQAFGEKDADALLRRLSDQPAGIDFPVIIVNTEKLSRRSETQMQRLCEALPIRDVRSFDRLLDDLCLVLHQPLATVTPSQQQILGRLHDPATVLKDRQVLVVDDDIRNIFAMTSILERYKMRVISAENGQEAIDVLQRTPDVDVVLMDIMMPGMDGYDTMRAIRKIAKFKALPIVALTAKAMKGDREKCIEAGASDYIAKPVHTDQLVAMLRSWLHR